MKVAMLAPVAWRTPPRHYGPWELVTSLLTEGLVARGVEVTLFATLDSQTSAVLRGVSPRGYAEDASMDGRVWEALHVATALSASTDFDLLHNQMDWLPLALSDLCHAPMLTTVHGFPAPASCPRMSGPTRRMWPSPRPIAPPSWSIWPRSITALISPSCRSSPLPVTGS
jgi:hypothetical protein